MRKSRLFFALVLAAVMFAGCATTFPKPDDADYFISNVQLSGPGTPGQYVLSYDVNVRNNGGVASPVLSLVDEDGGFNLGDDLLMQEQVTVSTSATAGTTRYQRLVDLACSRSGEVIFGSSSSGVRSSGESEAEVYGQVSKANGAGAARGPSINVTCR